MGLYLDQIDPIAPLSMAHRSSNKRYAGDNRLMLPESPYRQERLAPRCRLITSWLGRVFQGFVCSPIKVVRELGLDRRETGWPLSASFDQTSTERSYERSLLRAVRVGCCSRQAPQLPAYAISRYDGGRERDLLRAEQNRSELNAWLELWQAAQISCAQPELPDVR